MITMKICPDPAHYQAARTDFCLNFNCKGNRLFCSHCFLDRHQKHSQDVIHLLPIAKNSKLQNLVKNCSYSEDETKQIVNSFDEIRKQIKKKKTQIQNLLKRYQQIIEINIQNPLLTLQESFQRKTVQKAIRKILLVEKQNQDQKLEIIAKNILEMESQPQRTISQIKQKIQVVSKQAYSILDQQNSKLLQGFNKVIEKIADINIWQIWNSNIEKQINNQTISANSFFANYTKLQQTQKKILNSVTLRQQLTNYFTSKSLVNPLSRPQFGHSSPQQQLFKHPKQNPIFLSNNKLQLNQAKSPVKIQSKSTIPTYFIKPPQWNQIQIASSQQDDYPRVKQIVNCQQNQLKKYKIQKAQRQQKSKIRSSQKHKKQKQAIIAFQKWGKCARYYNSYITIQQWIQLSRGLGYLKEIEVPISQKSKILEIPYEFSYLKNVQHLKLVDCNITRINYLPTSLKQLNLSHNRISKIENLQKLKYLQTIFLCKNKIEKIQNFDKNENLKHINLNLNNIQQVENINHLSKLCYLVLSNNNIQTIEDQSVFPILRIWSSQVQIFLDNNPIKKSSISETLTQQDIYLNIQRKYLCKCLQSLY